MRTALGRARRLVTLVLLGLSAWYLFLRRRVAPRPVEWQTGPVPAGRSGAELGAAGELPDDVLATDAGLTELPDPVPAEPSSAGLAAEPADLPAAFPAAPLAAVEPADAVGEVPAVEPPDGVVVVDAVRLDEVLAEGPDGEPELVEVVDETVTVADLAGPVPFEVDEPVVEGSPDAPTEQFVRGLDDGIEEPTSEIPRPVFAETPSPAFSEAPTMEMPVLMDDLRAVRGIGPSMERMLHGLGIVSFRQLALLDGTELERVRHELRDFRSRIEREDWIGQARQLHKTKYGTDPV